MATSTGLKVAGQGRNVSRGLTAWSNPSRVTADDGSNATNAIGFGSTSDWLVADTFDFSSIPSDAKITGVRVRIQASSSGSQTISQVNIGKTDASLGTAKTVSVSVTGSMVDYDFGGADDL